MASSDYELRGSAAPTPHARLATALNRAQSTITVTGYSAGGQGDLVVGMGVMIGDEIMRLDSIELPTLTVGRGAADTIPQQHSAGDSVWFFSRAAGSDPRQYASAEVVGVKLTNKTIYGGSVPVEQAAPKSLTLNWRHTRPYPPGNVKVNGTAWYVGPVAITPSNNVLTVTWANRNRITQADQLISHPESNIDGETGQTCFAQIVRSDGVTVVFVDLGVTGTSWSMGKSELEDALGGANRTGTLLFGSIRDGHASWQHYTTPVLVSDSDLNPLTVSELPVSIN